MKYISIIFLAFIISSCHTIPEPIIVKEQVLPQEVKFPSIPVIENIEYSEDEKIVYVPDYIWMNIAEYMLDVKKTEELYLLFRQ